MRRVVVTGRGAISPIGCTPEDIWDSLCACRSGIAPLRIASAPSLPVRDAGIIRNFSPRAYSIPAKSLKVMNKTIQYALAASACAVREAGIAGDEYRPDEIGIFLGVSGIQYTAEELFVASCEAVGGDMRQYMDHEHRAVGSAVALRDSDAAVHPLWPLSVLANMALCQLAIQHDFQGLNCAFSSIDAAGGQAIGEAFTAIRRGTADMIIAGASYGLNTLELLSLAGAGLLADNAAACRPFDRDRSGCVPGEGAAIFVLEERERAMKRGARIYAELVGYGSWCAPAAYSAPDDTRAHEPLCRCLELALQDAELSPAAISCICADGKGTVREDRREARAYEQLFGACSAMPPLSTATPLTGYLLSAHSAFSAMAALLCLEHEAVPPLAHFNAPDQGCGLLFPKKTLKKQLEYVMSNTFGFSGEHTTLIFHRATY